MSDNVWAASSRTSTLGASSVLVVALGVSMWFTGMCTSDLETLGFASRQMTR